MPINRSKIIGETDLLSKIEELFTTDQRTIVNLYGSIGTGKTLIADELFKFLRKLGIKTKKIDTRQTVDIEDMSKYNVVILDDIERAFTQSKLHENIHKVWTSNSTTSFLMTSKTNFLEYIYLGADAYAFELGKRSHGYDDFKAFLYSDRNFEELRDDKEFEERLIQNLYLFSKNTANFNIFRDLVENTILEEDYKSPMMKTSTLYKVLQKENFTKAYETDFVIQLENPAYNDIIFSIRKKDKIEKVRDILYNHYKNDRETFFQLLDQQDNTKDLLNQDSPLSETIMRLCLYKDPIDVLESLMSTSDIMRELNRRKILDAGKGISTKNSRKRLIKYLLRDLGFNILEIPKNLHSFKRMVDDYQKKIDNESQQTPSLEEIFGMGIHLFNETEKQIFELMNFYTTLYFDSFNNFVFKYNKHTGEKLRTERITFGKYIGLMHVLNTLTQNTQYHLKNLGINRNHPIPQRLIDVLETKIHPLRKHFAHNSGAFKSSKNKDEIIGIFKSLVEHINSLIEYLESDMVMPDIIKIKQIVFDEYGRKLFTGYNFDEKIVRFTITEHQEAADIFSQYYFLDKTEGFSIHPVIVPRLTHESKTLFKAADQYDRKSKTQRSQGDYLLNQTELNDHDRILDIGCGNGKTTLDLYEKNPTTTIDAFDISSSMIDIAKKNMKDRNIDSNHINFFQMDAIVLDESNTYDLIFSNATLHWITKYEEMYRRIYEALKPGGRIALHVGGQGSYRGLHDMVQKAIENLELESYYVNWNYKIYYPSKEEIKEVLKKTGFTSIDVESVETDGEEYENLYEDFSQAGMLPYKHQLPNEKLAEALEQEYLRLCYKNRASKYSHRLFIHAKKEDDSK